MAILGQKAINRNVAENAWEKSMTKSYFDATDESAIALFSRNITGEVVMLNLLRFLEQADYADFPDLAPELTISGREAFQKYIDHTLPILPESGGDKNFSV